MRDSQQIADPERVPEFIALFTANELRLRAFAFTLVPNWADAEEVLQQANVVIWRKFGTFQAGSNFFAWASKILFLAAKDYRKRQKREKRVFSEQFLDEIADEVAQSTDELDDRGELLSECVNLLKAKHRQMLRLRYYEGCSTAEVAQAAGSTNKAIYTAMGRIHKVLFDCVERKLVSRRLS
jgi:RNA polymerase sigma-70 factor (ECF subfamily)